MLRSVSKFRAPLARSCRSFTTIGVPGTPGNGTFSIPEIKNEPVRDFEPGSKDRQGVLNSLKTIKESVHEIPVVIAGRKYWSEKTGSQYNPYDKKEIAKVSQATPEDVTFAIETAMGAKKEWANASFADRAAVFLKAAELIAGKYRYDMLAATMIGQGKNVYQAEIDTTCELADFLRFNVKYAQELYQVQPAENSPGVWNRAEYRALDGFVYAVTPFNFTAIAANLVGAPALMGNTVVWKPSAAAVLSNYYLYQILIEAGLPEGVVSFVPGNAQEVTKTVLGSEDFASLHFTGSTGVFQTLNQEIAAHLPEYNSYPRIVGETGGKNYHLIHPTADLSHAVKSTVRGAFEYQGQKCSACSRAYVPENMWEDFKKEIQAEVKNVTVGDATTPEGFASFAGPVIHQQSFDKLKDVIDAAKKDDSLELVAGGKYDDSKGFYVEPTIYVTRDPDHPNLKTEFFGPILTVCLYDEVKFLETCEVVDKTTKYGLTGAIFASDRYVISQASERLRYSAGNFYINDKCTGAVVGQQWFGGGRQSGTNDKAGSGNILSRFVSIRNIKENFRETDNILYPSNYN